VNETAFVLHNLGGQNKCLCIMVSVGFLENKTFFYKRYTSESQLELESGDVFQTDESATGESSSDAYEL
jgi:hypothetical protein